MTSKAFSNLLAAVEKAKHGGSSYDDDKANFWRCETDKAGNGYAIIRFLPGIDDDTIPFVKLYNHGFKGDNGRWFIENCPTTIDQECPVCGSNSVLWNSGKESDKEIARKRKRKLSYISNILVIQDSRNPDNEGKVFMFKYGQKIFDKLADKMKPQFEDETPVNPFDPVEGANFKLKIRQVEGYGNYDKSEFETVSKIDGLKDVMKGLHDIGALIAPSKFKSQDELRKKLSTVLGGEAAIDVKSKGVIKEEDEPKVAPVAKPVANLTSDPDQPSDDEDDLDYFRKLAEED